MEVTAHRLRQSHNRLMKLKYVQYHTSTVNLSPLCVAFIDFVHCKNCVKTSVEGISFFSRYFYVRHWKLIFLSESVPALFPHFRVECALYTFEGQ